MPLLRAFSPYGTRVKITLYIPYSSNSINSIIIINNNNTTLNITNNSFTMHHNSINTNHNIIFQCTTSQWDQLAIHTNNLQHSLLGT